MGEERVQLLSPDMQEMQNFVRQLLNDVKALEHMLKNNWFEDDVMRIGAEQEMCLINNFYKPACTAMEIIDDIQKADPTANWLTTELAQFNLEINLNPRVFEGDALADMEKELRQRLDVVQNAAEKHKTRILLTGILPSLRKFDLHMDKITPKERYRALMKALQEKRGSDYELHLDGIDELNIRHDSPFMEACNTSFQVHLQVQQSNFVKMYNIAQAITGPVLAMCANSPILLGKRLWHETRIGLFQQSIDNRKSRDHMRDRSPRVTFGTDWLQNSVLDIYREDITRFRILLGSLIKENSIDQIKEGIIPKLQALQVHTGTVYRWNRPCYGISDTNKPHLRIENRVLGAGPTVLDEIANTAFWLGLMEGMAEKYDDITKHMSFDDARDNFVKGAKLGIDCKFTWTNDQKISARDLVTSELLPLARQGLKKRNINPEHIDKYLGIIEERAKQHMNGARWILRTFSKFKKETTVDESLTTLTAAIYHNQKQSQPAHTWKVPELHEFNKYDPSTLLVEEFMTTDLVTVQQSDLLEFAATLMNWNDQDYIAVEDDNGVLYGIIYLRKILQHFADKENIDDISAINSVKDLMEKNPTTVGPQSTILEVIKTMRDLNVKALPVVKHKELIGMISEQNFVMMSKRLIQRMHNE